MKQFIYGRIDTSDETFDTAIRWNHSIYTLDTQNRLYTGQDREYTQVIIHHREVLIPNLVHHWLREGLEVRLEYEGL